MKYEQEEAVRVLEGLDLIPGVYIIDTVYDDDTMDVHLEASDPEDLTVIKGLKEDEVLYDHEYDKLAELWIERTAIIIEKLADVEELEMIHKEDEDINFTCYMDATVSGLATSFTDCFETLDAMYNWFNNGQFGYYGISDLYYCGETDMYYYLSRG